MSLLADVVALLGVLLVVLSVAGAPAYLFEDVLGLSEPLAYGLGAGVWAIATLLVLGAPRLDYAGMLVLEELVGVSIENPLTIAGGMLTVFYGLAALGFAEDSSTSERGHGR